MKRKREITRFSFMVKDNELVLKVSAVGQRDKIIKCPPQDQNENMDVEHAEEEEDSTCPICMAPYDDQKQIIVFHCGHLFHQSCILSSLTQSMKCPFCRDIPPTASLNNINCIRCKRYIEEDAGDNDISAAKIVMSMKCQHLHISYCQTAHLATLDTEFPPTPEGLDQIRQANIHGCYSLTNNIQDTPRQADIIHQVRFHPGMPRFVELGDNTPDNVSFPPILNIPPPLATGANAVPVRPIRPINRPTIPPPARPAGTGAERRERSPLRQRPRGSRQERSRSGRRRD